MNAAPETPGPIVYGRPGPPSPFTTTLETADTRVATRVLYPRAYAGYVLLSCLDVLLTWMILHAGGVELNVLANWVIQRWDATGIVAYKFAIVGFVLCLCEVIGRRNVRTGRVLAGWAVAIAAIPVIVALLEFGAAAWN
ncbi:MAG: hypothetical protein JXA69_16950 [Phycisphaerae bacterium]|nr:hypothetical protein [Phycisphaerae bacterium]